MNQLIEKANKLVIFFLAYTLVFVLFFGTLGYTLPFVLALLFALILQRPTHYLMTKLKIKNAFASLITTTIFFTIIISVLSIGVAIITNEAIQLGKTISSYVANNSPKFQSYFDQMTDYYNNLDPSIVKAIEDNFSSFITKLSNGTVWFLGVVVSISLGILGSVPYLIMVILFTLLATYFFTKDFSSAKDKMMNLLPKADTNRIAYVVHETRKMLSNYLLSYFLIIVITFIETLIAFSVFKVNYAVILSVICAIFDILPILGIGTIYLPLVVIYALSGNYVTAIGLIICYAIVTIIRQVIEPKIVSSSLGMHPVSVLAALFIGLKANGIAGMFFCVFLVVFYNIFKKVNIL